MRASTNPTQAFLNKIGEEVCSLLIEKMQTTDDPEAARQLAEFWGVDLSVPLTAEQKASVSRMTWVPIVQTLVAAILRASFDAARDSKNSVALEQAWLTSRYRSELPRRTGLEPAQAEQAASIALDVYRKTNTLDQPLQLLQDNDPFELERNSGGVIFIRLMQTS